MIVFRFLVGTKIVLFFVTSFCVVFLQNNRSFSVLLSDFEPHKSKLANGNMREKTNSDS